MNYSGSAYRGTRTSFAIQIWSTGIHSEISADKLSFCPGGYLPTSITWIESYPVERFISKRSNVCVVMALRLNIADYFDVLLLYISKNYPVGVDDASDPDTTGFTQSANRAVHQAVKSGHYLPCRNCSLGFMPMRMHLAAARLCYPRLPPNIPYART